MTFVVLGFVVGALVGFVFGVFIGFSLYKRAGTWD